VSTCKEQRQAAREAFEQKALEYWIERRSLIDPIDKMLTEKYSLEEYIGGYECEHDIETVSSPHFFSVSVYRIEEMMNNE
jgi:hypothetical protein